MEREGSLSDLEIREHWQKELDRNDWISVWVECPRCRNQWIRRLRKRSAQCSRCRKHFQVNGDTLIALTRRAGRLNVRN